MGCIDTDEKIDWVKYYNHSGYPDYQNKEIVIKALETYCHENVIKYINIEIDEDIERIINKNKLLGTIIKTKDYNSSIPCDGAHISIHDDPYCVFFKRN